MAPGRTVALAAMFAAAVTGGCTDRAKDFPRSTFEVVDGAFRTFTVAHGPVDAPTTCADFLAEHPLRGILKGDVADPERIWIETAGGRVSVVWPHGFRVVPAETGLVLVSDRGQVVAKAGQSVVLEQVRVEDHTGTYGDPYVAGGVAFGQCYPYVPAAPS